MSATAGMPKEPHPEGPTEMTWNQLACEQIALEEAHAAHDVSRMLRGLVSNVHLLAKLSREAKFTPSVGHAHYIYGCYLKSQINSSRPPSDCDLGSVWSLQVDLDKDMPKACALAMKPSLCPQDPSGITCHWRSSTPKSRRWGACQLLWLRHQDTICC